MSGFFNTQMLISLVTSFIASVAFAVIFRVNKRHLILGGVAGLVTYFIYYTAEFLTGAVFIAALVSTLFTALFSEIAARVRRAPAIVFLIAGVIPTVPGGALYRAMRYGLESSWELSFANLIDALLISLGISSGILIVAIAFAVMKDKQRKRPGVNKEKGN